MRITLLWCARSAAAENSSTAAGLDVRSKEYGRRKNIDGRFMRCSGRGLFNKIYAALAANGGKSGRLMIGAPASRRIDRRRA